MWLTQPSLQDCLLGRWREKGIPLESPLNQWSSRPSRKAGLVNRVATETIYIEVSAGHPGRADGAQGPHTEKEGVGGLEVLCFLLPGGKQGPENERPVRLQPNSLQVPDASLKLHSVGYTHPLGLCGPPKTLHSVSSHLTQALTSEGYFSDRRPYSG